MKTAEIMALLDRNQKDAVLLELCQKLKPNLNGGVFLSPHAWNDTVNVVISKHIGQSVKLKSGTINAILGKLGF